ncbi:cytokinin riboside 5'-monophosphate phosphoribohydrolase [Bacteroidia bacterium]|nr:cytokinin riboside 5'-monophosphate phosphoribohydrolase [Bacteroidia bacterium]
MFQEIKTITVYAASSAQISPVYFQAAKSLGKLLADNRITCINGAGCNGLMAAITDSMLENGGKICGIIPQFMIDKGWIHSAIPEVIITPDMHTRKQLMAQKADACIALPGGVGTLEELLEVITWKQLGLYEKPIVILNTNGFYDDLLALFEKVDREHFFHHRETEMWQIASTPQAAVEMLLNK